MPKTIKEERLRWILPIYNKEVKLVDRSKQCPYSKRSLERWLATYRKYGEKGLESKSTRPRSHPNETPIRDKERIIELRRKTKLCALKLNYKLKKEGISINTRTIGKIVKNEGLVRRYRVRKLKCKYIRVPMLPGELLEIDVKYVPKRVNKRKYYQFTAIDCSSRWRYLKVYDSIGNNEAIDFLKEVIKVASFRIRAIKTDNGSCFTNRYTGYLKSTDPLNPKLHSLDLLCQRLNIIHYLIDPGKPAQNGKVERSHRTDQEMFYDRTSYTSLEELEYRIKLWNMYYNDLEHCALNGKTPNEMLLLA
ncbi:MAG: IS481 family transposase [Candidatus Komeilibacteria bacterium]